MSRRKRGEDDENHPNYVIPILWCLGGILVAMGVVGFGLSIGLWIRTDGNSSGDAVLRDAFTDLQDNVTALQNCTDCQLSQTVAELQSNFSTFQNGTCTCPDNAPVVTIIEQGRLIWHGGTASIPYSTCVSPQVTVPGYAIVSGGTGYRVGDLFTVADDNIDYSLQAMLEITSVGVSGDVLAFTVLGPGCLTLPVGNITLQTFSVVGTGLTVQLWAGAYTPLLTDPYYYGWNHQLQPRWVGAPQYGNWTVNLVQEGGFEYITMVIYPPELPMVLQIPPGMTPFATTYVRIQISNFIPRPTYGLQSIFKLTPSEVASISVTDDTSCYATGPCIFSLGFQYPSRVGPFFRNSYILGNDLGSSTLLFPDISGSIILTTTDPVDYDYVANNAVFTMSGPLTLKLLP